MLYGSKTYLLSSIWKFLQMPDGDGIINTIDLDDDNDGILDAIESPTCFYTAIELGKPIAVSSDLAAYSTYVITNSIDNSPSSLSAFAASVNWVNKEIFNFTAVDLIGILALLKCKTYNTITAIANTPLTTQLIDFIIQFV